MKKHTLLFIAPICITASSCESGTRPLENGGTRLATGTGDFCDVYTIERDGRKFAVAVGSRGGCSIIELK